MAIESNIKLSANKDFDGAYIRVQSPRSFKELILEETKIKLMYDYEVFSEKGGVLLIVSHSITCDYNGGDIWSESYADLKKQFTNSKNI